MAPFPCPKVGGNLGVSEVLATLSRQSEELEAHLGTCSEHCMTAVLSLGASKRFAVRLLSRATRSSFKSAGLSRACAACHTPSPAQASSTHAAMISHAAVRH